MDALFFISIACFFALFVAALAIAHHVRLEGMTTRADNRQEIDRTHRLSKQQLHAVEDREPAVQSLQNLIQQKEPDWRFLVSKERNASRAQDRTSPAVYPELRKPPSSARSDSKRRPDWAYYNKDLGDLSDPYQPPTIRAAGGGRRSGLLTLPRKDAS